MHRSGYMWAVWGLENGRCCSHCDGSVPSYLPNFIFDGVCLWKTIIECKPIQSTGLRQFPRDVTCVL